MSNIGQGTVDYSAYMPYIDVATGMQRIRNNAKLYLTLLGSFTKGNYQQQLISDFESMNIDNLKVSVHTVKGAAANLSFDKLSETCKNYEQIIKDNAVNQTNFNELIEIYNTTIELIERLKEQLSNPA